MFPSLSSRFRTTREWLCHVSIPGRRAATRRVKSTGSQIDTDTSRLGIHDSDPDARRWIHRPAGIFDLDFRLAHRTLFLPPRQRFCPVCRNRRWKTACSEVVASYLYTDRIGAEKRGGLNGSMQHLLKVFLYESTRLISFPGVY